VIEYIGDLQRWQIVAGINTINYETGHSESTQAFEATDMIKALNQMANELCCMQRWSEANEQQRAGELHKENVNCRKLTVSHVGVNCSQGSH